MKYPRRIYYTETDKGLMWDRWEKGEAVRFPNHRAKNHMGPAACSVNRPKRAKEAVPAIAPKTARATRTTTSTSRSISQALL